MEYKVCLYDGNHETIHGVKINCVAPNAFVVSDEHGKDVGLFIDPQYIVEVNGES